ncbi:MAG: ubiquinone/menaquinone biosynthesis methyltransferase [Gemmatimonadaceae bacterium]
MTRANYAHASDAASLPHGCGALSFHRMLSADTERREALEAAEGGPLKRAYVRGIFSDIAPRYDFLNHLLSFNIDRTWRRRAVAELGWKARSGGTYLDLCAGTLDVAVELGRQRGFKGTVIGADFAEPMLRTGQPKTTRLPVRSVVADILELPFADAATSGAIVAFGIRNVADLDASLREIHRVLLSGARLVILEFSVPRSRVVRFVYNSYFHFILPMVGRLVSGHPTAYRYLPESVANFPSENQLAARMKTAGFVNVRWYSLTPGIAAIHVGERAGPAAGAGGYA